MVLLAFEAGAGALYLRQVKADVRRYAAEDLTAVARLKVLQIAKWSEERHADGAAIGAQPLVARAAWLAQRGSAAARADLQAWCRAQIEHRLYRTAAVFGADGRLLASAGPALEMPPVADAIRAGRPIFSDLHLDAGGVLHNDLVVPLFLDPAGRARPAGVALLRVAPEDHFIPLVAPWPTADRSGQVLLARPAGDSVKIVSASAAAGGTAGAVLRPLATGDLPAARAARGESGVLEGTDRRGRRVLAVAAPLPASIWRLLVQMDEDEIEEPLRERRTWVLLAGAAVGAAVLAGALLWRRAQREAARRGEHEAEMRRLALERHFAFFTRHANDILLLVDAELRVAYANDQAVAAYGFEQEDLLGKPARDLLAPPSRTDLPSRLREAAAGVGRPFEAIHLRRDGSSFPAEVSLRVFEVEGERYTQAVIRDITERKRAEESLRRSEERLRLALESSDIGLWDWQVRRDEVHLSATLAGLLGRAPDETATGEAIRRFLGVDDPSRSERWQALLDGRNALFEEELRLAGPGGEDRWLLARARVVERDRAGRALRLVGTCTDLTDKKAAADRLAATAQLASLGAMAAQVALEIERPLKSAGASLAAARDFAAQLSGSLPRDPGPGDGPAPFGAGWLVRELRRTLDEGRRHSERVRQLARDLRSLSGAAEARRPVDLRHAVEAATGLAQGAAETRARLSKDLAPAPLVHVNEAALGHVVLGVLLAAVRAVPEGEPHRNEIRVVTGPGPSGSASIEIRNVGRGIPPEDLHHLFDRPAEAGETGTGIDLAFCRDIVDDLGGAIEVTNEAGQGSVFRVLLPTAAEAGAPP